MEARRPQVVVGVDGGLASVAAVEAAAAEAARRGGDLVVVTCWPGQARRVDGLSFRCESEREAATLLDETISHATNLPAEVHLERRVLTGHAGPGLVGASYDADVLVLGSLGSGLHAHGSVLDHCVRFAACPVLVVPWTATSSFRPEDVEADLHLRPSRTPR